MHKCINKVDSNINFSYFFLELGANTVLNTFSEYENFGHSKLMNKYKNFKQFQQNQRKGILIGKDADCNESIENDAVDFFLSNSNQNDENCWIELIQVFENEEPHFDYYTTELLVSNSIQIAETCEPSVIFHILLFIFYILQKHSQYVTDIFEKTQISIFIGSIITDSDSEIDLIIQAFNILDTYLHPLNDDEDFKIQWASELLCKLNALIDSGIENPIFSLSLSNSQVLLEKGVFTTEEMHHNFVFYISLIKDLPQVDLFYGIKNFEIILNRFPCFYDEFYNSYHETFEFIYNTLSSNNPLIVQSSINILIPIISYNDNYFLRNDFIQICLQQVQDNKNEDLAYSFTKFLIKFCSISQEACIQLISFDFLKCKNLLQYGYRVTTNLIQILKHIVDKTKIYLDSFTTENISYLLDSFIFSDKDSDIITVLDTVISLLPINFPFSEYLIENICRLTEDSDINALIIEKASFIIQKLNHQNN